jgi:hypothetical protein
MIDSFRRVLSFLVSSLWSMLAHLSSLFGADRYLPWAWSLTYDKLLMDLYLIANVLSGLAFVLVGVTLGVHHDRGICFTGQQRLLLGWMLLLMGFHLILLAVTIYVPIYRLDILIKSAGAGISVVFALTTTRFVLDYGRR